MRSRLGRRAATPAGLVAAGALALALPIAVAGATPLAVTDAAGDTITEAVEDPINAPQVDIVSTIIDSRPEGLLFSIRVKQPVDPMSDPNWASEDTGATWTIDVNGDGKRDYVVEYYVDPDTHQLTGSQYRTGGGSAPADTDTCEEPPATYSQDAGYSLAVDPRCLGNPSSLSYRVAMSYDTDAKLDSAETAIDTSPGDDAWSDPVTVTLPAGVTPGTFPVRTPSSPPPPSSATSEGSAQSTPTQPTSAAPNKRHPIKPHQASPGVASRPTTATPEAPAPALARTGLYDRTTRLTGFAVGIVLIGAGLLIANRRPSASHLKQGDVRRSELKISWRKFCASA